jgi:pimeloyl-ACP methyl ester carboxylesterase
MALALSDTRYGQGRTLLCLPGGPGMQPDYIDPLAGLAGPRRQVVLLHPRGTGDSPRPADSQDYSIGEYAADTVAWIRRHAAGPVDLLGHSHGGIVAARVAAEHPGLVRCLVLLGVPAYGGERAVSEAADLHLARHGEPACEAAMAALAAQGDEYPNESDLGRLIAAVIPLWVGPMNERIRAWQANVAAKPANVDALRYFNALVFPTLDDVLRDVGKAGCPILAVSGDLDGWAGADHLAAFQQVARDCRTVLIPGSAHMCQIDAAETVNDVISKFLNETRERNFS